MSPAAPQPRTRPVGSDLRDLVPLRPQGPIEIVDRATQVFRTRAKDLLAVSLAVQVPVWLMLAAALRDQWAKGLNDNAAWYWVAIVPDPILFVLAADDATSGGALIFILGRGLPSLALAVIGATCGLLVREWAQGNALGGLDALSQVARRGHHVLALWAMVHLLEIATCVGVVVGPLILGIAAPLMMLERIGPVQTLVRCWRLARVGFGRALALVPTATLVASLTGGLLGVLPLPLLFALAGDWIDLGGTAVTALSGALPHLVLDPLLALAMALFALDLKVRFEGLDLEVALAETSRGG